MAGNVTNLIYRILVAFYYATMYRTLVLSATPDNRLFFGLSTLILYNPSPTGYISSWHGSSDRLRSLRNLIGCSLGLQSVTKDW